MNLGFYGHTSTAMLNFNLDGKYMCAPFPLGVNLLRTMESFGSSSSFEEKLAESEREADNYRKDYFWLTKDASKDDSQNFIVEKFLGSEEGQVPHSIASHMPKNDAALDMLYIWDMGYGGLCIPSSSKNILWFANKTLPEKEVFKAVSQKTFLVIDINALRENGAMISRQISWERTASDLVLELQTNPLINYLLDAQYIFVNFETDGAALVTKKEDGTIEASLILTHGGAEGATKEKMAGLDLRSATIMNLVLALIYPIIFQDFASLDTTKQKSGAVTLEDYIMQVAQNALSGGINVVSLGNLFRIALEAGETAARQGTTFNEETSRPNINISVNTREWDAFKVPLAPNDSGIYAALESWAIANSKSDKLLDDVAHDYVVNGAKVIDGLPQLNFGNFTTIDRNEIESYQNIRNLILGYAKADAARPLSIAVFGAPGSGKSFGVTEIAKNIMPGKIEKLEFNVSQFLTTQDLALAFQKVRDAILMGKLPLVFFDEFDSDKDGMALGWIKYFLMPMQDGRFKDGQGEHPLGKCILVFAGGTSSNFETFASPMYDKDEAIRQSFKNIKGPDFLSRLRGTINVLGPNKKDEDDVNFILRRALLLRSIITRKLKIGADGKLPVSDNILHAMLHVPEFKHGARSMEAILDMSRIENDFWSADTLPFSSQLSLHLDADEFDKTVRNII